MQYDRSKLHNARNTGQSHDMLNSVEEKAVHTGNNEKKINNQSQKKKIQKY